MAEPSPSPQRIGSYEILALLGDGGSGPLYHGLHTQLARPAAIKVLRHELAEDPSVVRRFQREARIAAQLHHPNIVEIYDTAEHDGFHYIARGLVDGQTLREIIDERRLAAAETVRIARQLAEALDYAHGQGVIHRGMNPGGVIIDRRGHLTIVDFGIAGAVEDLIPVSTDPDAMSRWFEHPAYVTPEQATGQPAVPASDIYGLGAIVYEMVTGAPPFGNAEPSELLAKLQHDTPEPPSQRTPELPAAVDDVIMRALANTATDRYASAAEFVDALAPALGVSEQARGRIGIPPIVLAQPATGAQPAAAAGISPRTPALPLPEPIVIERVVYRSRRHEPAVWYGIGTTLLSIALLLNLFWNDDDRVRADVVVPTATVTITTGLGANDPTTTAASATEEIETTATTAATEPTTLTPTAEPTKAASPTTQPSPTVAATATPSTTATTVPPPPPSLASGGELILYSTAREDIPGGLIVTRPDGAEQVSVFDDLDGFSNAGQFALAPDGSALAFAATPDDGSDSEVYVYIVADGTLQQLTDTPGDDTQPQWSPDGSRVAFISHRDANSEVYVMNADGSQQTNVSNDSGGDFSHAWSPDGEVIAFASNRTGNIDIFAVDANGGNLRNLTNNPAVDWGPAWSPDGARMAFGSNRDGNDDVFVMNADGSDPRNLTNDPAADNNPVWSPDGGSIAFVSNRDGSSDVFVMTADGANPTPIGATIEVEDGPVWSPDSSEIAYVQTIEGNSDILIAALDGTPPRRLTSDPAADTAPIWVSLPESAS